MGDNEVWCRAWRLLVKHQDKVDGVIADEIERCRMANDPDGVAYWQKVSAALEDFR